MATGKICFAVRIGYYEGNIYLGTGQSDTDAMKQRARSYPSNANSNSPKMSIFEIIDFFRVLKRGHPTIQKAISACKKNI